MKTHPILLAIAIVGLPVAIAYAAPSTHPQVSMAAARAKALQIVPHASVKAAELEREHGKLVYSFDLTLAGRPGVEEVQIDAQSGKLVSHTHESPAKEAQEKRAEEHAQPPKK